jgi:hypothetical protein
MLEPLQARLFGQASLNCGMGSIHKPPRISLAGALHKSELVGADTWAGYGPASLEAVVKELATKVHLLQLENKSLSVRKEILHGAWLASRQATYFLGCRDVLGQHRSSQLHAAQTLENVLLQSLRNDPAFLSDPLQRWIPWKATPGISTQLLASFVDLSLVHGKSQASLLDSTFPSSLIICPLLCLCYDPAASDIKRGQGAGREEYAKAQQQLEVLLSQAASATDGSPTKAQLMRDVAVTVLYAARTDILGQLVLQPACHLHEHVFLPGEQYLPPDALLDQLTEDAHIRQDQVREFLSVVEVYKHLLDPLAKEKKSIMARITQLLQTGQCSCSPPSSPAQQHAYTPQASPTATAHASGAAAGIVGVTSPERAAAAAGGKDAQELAHVPAAAAGAASASSISVASSGVAYSVVAAFSSPSAPVACCSHAPTAGVECDGSSMSYDSFLSRSKSSTSSASSSCSSSMRFPLGTSHHHELLALLEQLKITMAKTAWLDKCCFFTCLGSLTWWQLGTLFTGFQPFPPLCGLLVRRIVARASFPLLMQVQLQPLPGELLSPMERWRLRMGQQGVEVCQRQQQQDMTG